MREQAYFRNVPNIGTLHIKDELFIFEKTPMVFTCTDKDDRQYLCVCTDIIQEESWLIAEISEQELQDILTNNKTILSAYKDKTVIVATKPFGKKIHYVVTPYNNINPDELPAKDQYLSQKESEDAHEYENL